MQNVKSRIFEVNRVRLYDWLTFGYLIIWIILIGIYFSRIPFADVFLALHLVGLMLSVVLAGIAPRLSLLIFLRRWYPAFFLPLFFTAMHYLIPAIHPQNIDRALIQLDYFLTGTNPTVWMERFYHPGLTELLQFSYLTFYFLPLVVLIPICIARDRDKFNRVAFNLLLGFYLSYLAYLLFPALGPRYFLAQLHDKPLQGFGIYRLVHSALNGLENVQWDAFPSGHITIALIFSYSAFLFYRKVFYWTLPIIFLLTVSTVYLRYHYVVDVLAGIFLFLLIIVIDMKIYHNRPEK